MKNFFDFLSGNVPGGITLYLFLIIILFLVLFYLYRNSELVTRAHFAGWFVVFFVIFTAVYLYFWTKNPPADILNRYSVFITAQEEKDDWLAYFFRDEISTGLKSFDGRTTYLFPQWWNYLANSHKDFLEPEVLAGKLKLQKVAFGKIYLENKQYVIEFHLKDISSGKEQGEFKTRFTARKPQEAIPEILLWLKNTFPVNGNYRFKGVPEREFVLARDNFYRGNYGLSRQLFEKLMKQFPENKEVSKWNAYNNIRLAAGEWKKNRNRNPYEKRKEPWQVRLAGARAILKAILKENMTAGMKDDFLSNMMGESYLLEENFNEADVFFKNAYVENPFNVTVLDNITNLHQSRYKDYGFIDVYDIYARIIDICPVYENVLIKYCDKLLRKGPIHGVPSKRARELIENFLAINPNSAPAWILLGEYYRSTLNKEKAVEALRKAASLDPDNSLVQYNLGVINYMDKKPQVAEKFFRKALEIDDYLDAHLYLGAIYMERGDYETALKEFRYRVAHKKGDDDPYALEAMKGIRKCLEELNLMPPTEWK